MQIITAVAAYLKALEGGAKGKTDEVLAALAELKRAHASLTFADDALLEAARETYALGSNDDVEIDTGAMTSIEDEGTWVQAWVWMRHKEPDEDACRECGEDSSGGEGYDGLCGNCADRAFGESEG